MNRKSKGREYALLSLFPHFVGEEDCHDTYEFLLEEREPGPQVKEFSKVILEGVLANKSELDQLIDRHLKSWDIERLGNLELTVLRIGAFELKHQPKTKISIILNEAVNLAENFADTSAAKFVNGVLGSMAKEIREGEED